MTGEAVNPLVDGVKHRAIPTDGDKGFAITIVPESDATPHMAKCGHNRYFKRSGDSFYPMEHFDLEDMFGRRKKPKLVVIAEAHYSLISATPEGSILSVTISIGNQGRGVAKSPYLHLMVPIGFEKGTLFNLREIKSTFRLDDSNRVSYYFGATSELTIHPGVIVQVVLQETLPKYPLK